MAVIITLWVYRGASDLRAPMSIQDNAINICPEFPSHAEHNHHGLSGPGRAWPWSPFTTSPITWPGPSRASEVAPPGNPFPQIWGLVPAWEMAMLTRCPSFWSFWRTCLNPERLGCPMPNTASPPRTCRKLGAPQLCRVPSMSVFSVTSRTRKQRPWRGRATGSLR